MACLAPKRIDELYFAVSDTHSGLVWVNARVLSEHIRGSTPHDMIESQYRVRIGWFSSVSLVRRMIRTTQKTVLV